jgi:hypothetical protein
MRRPLLAVALLLIAPMAIAQVYKWTDAHGTVHYSETPPPQGQHYKQIVTTGSAKPLAQPSSSIPEPGSENPPEPGATSEPVADTPENRAKLCTSLKANLETLKGSGPVVIEEGGQQKVLDDAQRKQQIATANSQYQQYCGGQ